MKPYLKRIFEMERMFCFQCQEALNNRGCKESGVCGKDPEIAILQDGLIYLLKGISQYTTRLHEKKYDTPDADLFIIKSLYMTITNVNFDPVRLVVAIKEAQMMHRKMADIFYSSGGKRTDIYFKEKFWETDSKEKMLAKAQYVGIRNKKNEDLCSFREFLIYGLKGIAAYVEQAYHFGYEDKNIFHFIQKALEYSIREDLTMDDYMDLILECGENGVKAMSLLDKAHCETYGHPRITDVNLGVRNNPGILISGHDLKDLEELLKQSAGKGVDIYTHCEMLPAHYYPYFRKYEHFVGNYGGAWWNQTKDFELFNGPILFTTNCIVPPPKEAGYTSKIYTTGTAGLEGVKHIPERKNGNPKNFKEIIEQAAKCLPPTPIENGTIRGGYGHEQLSKTSKQIAYEIERGNIQKIIMMGGCDGRMKSREYYTSFVENLPQDTIILTAGCAKFRYNKLALGDINGIPRVIDTGQCNDTYSIIMTVLRLKKLLDLHSINDVPIVYNMAWYEQKSIIILLSMLYMGIKNIHIGPTLPAFFSVKVLSLLQRQFGLNSIVSVEDDMRLLGIEEKVEAF
jgi:hydroxylamine reductase